MHNQKRQNDNECGLFQSQDTSLIGEMATTWPFSSNHSMDV
ncbi:8689_t:CDS:2 [Rhizophagus irregularis]|nr:8689_t:CDS:2 [Rhizophagus irregularis]